MYDHSVQNGMMEERGGREREREGEKREPEGEGGRWICVNDTWSKYGHSVPCMTVLFLTVWCRKGGRERGRWADLVSVTIFGIMYDHTVLNSIVPRRTMGTL